MRQLPEAFRSVSALEPRDLWETIGPRLVDSVYEPSIDRLEVQALTNRGRDASGVGSANA
jgi:hypothetical protein